MPDPLQRPLVEDPALYNVPDDQLDDVARLKREVIRLRTLLLDCAREFQPGTPPGGTQRFYQRVVQELDPR